MSRQKVDIFSPDVTVLSWSDGGPVSLDGPWAAGQPDTGNIAHLRSTHYNNLPFSKMVTLK